MSGGVPLKEVDRKELSTSYLIYNDVLFEEVLLEEVLPKDMLPSDNSVSNVSPLRVHMKLYVHYMINYYYADDFHTSDHREIASKALR